MSSEVSVLILEDNADKLRRIVAFLRDANLVESDRVITAPDGSTARRLLQSHLFDVFILDLAVPRMLGERADSSAGFELLEDLFDDSQLLMPAQIIGLTGFADLAERFVTQFAQHGAVLVKYDESSDGWQAAIEMCIRRFKARLLAQANAAREYDLDIAIVCARPNELAAVKRWVGTNWEDVTIRGDPTLYHRSEIRRGVHTYRIVAAGCPRMGLSAAAVTSTKLITHFCPRCIIMTGIAAGIRGRVELGDVLIADQSWDWGVGKWERDDAGLKFRPSPHSLSIDAELRTPIERIARDAQTLAQIRSDWPSIVPQSALSVVIGPLASGAAVVAAQTMTDQIAAQHRKLIGVDMETYGVFAAADEAVRPKPRAMSIKAVSDFADEEKDDKWQSYAAYASACVLRELLTLGL